MNNNWSVEIRRYAGISSTAWGYELRVVVLLPRGRRIARTHPNLTAASMRRFYGLAERAAGRPVIDIRVQKAVDTLDMLRMYDARAK